MSSAGPPITPSRFAKRTGVEACAIAAVFALVIAWSSWPTLQDLVHRWGTDPQFSGGFIVPLMALIVLYFRRDRIAFGEPTSWGLSFFLFAAVCRLLEAKFYLPWFGPFALIPMFTGIVLIIGGWQLLRWAWPGLVLLLFMLPLPYTLEVLLARPLQQMATVGATFLLQTLGYPAFAEGNMIFINEHPLNVLEACNGLGMLVVFFAEATAMAMILDTRPLVDRFVIFISAIPIALLINLIRIVVTAMVHVSLGSSIHDAAGLLMPAAAFITLWLELCLYDRLFVLKQPTSTERPSSAMPATGLKVSQSPAALHKMKT